MYCEHREHNRNTNVLKGSLFSTRQGLWQAYIILGGIKMEYASWKLYPILRRNSRTGANTPSSEFSYLWI